MSSPGEKKHNILIVCWEFPPHHGIGGRRWSKIAKSLVRAGHAVSVISLRSGEASLKKTWIGPEVLSKLKLYTCQASPLVKWLHDYSSPLRFLKIRIAKALLSSLYKGTIYDKAIGVEKQFSKLAREVIVKDKIDLLFVTGAPFNLLYYCAKLRHDFPALKMIADYRDPWLLAQNYGMKGLSAQRMKSEQDKQDLVFEQMDLITAPNPFLLEEIRNTYAGKARRLARFAELPHAFDPDDVVLKETAPRSSSRIRILYGGTMYMDIDPALVLLNKAITACRQSGGLWQPELVFYTNELSKQALFAENADCVRFSGQVGDKIFDEVQSADLVLILLSEHNKNYTTSKFFEFMPYRKPYLYVGPEGFVSEKIERERLGFCIRKPEDLAGILAACKNNAAFAGLSIEKYTFDAVTSNLLKQIYPG